MVVGKNVLKYYNIWIMLRKKMKTKIVLRLHRLAPIIEKTKICVNLCNLWTNKIEGRTQ